MSAGQSTAIQPRARAPLTRRLAAERRAARARIAARVARPLAAEERSFDPLLRGRLSAGDRLQVAILVVVGSAAFHLALFGVGRWAGGGEGARKRDRIAIQVQERVKKVEEPPKSEPPKQTIERPPPKKVEVTTAKPPPRETPPPEPVKGSRPPPRVVGLSLDSTAAGGSGASFGVGNTREGETRGRAADPGKVDPAGAKTPAEQPASPNQTASRIPTAGAKYVLPKRRKPIEPAYPDTLKSQGIEADVTVMVKLDAAGKVIDVRIIKKSDHSEFDEAARQAALREQFDPATRDGTAIPYTLSYTYRFRLKGE